MGRSNQGGSILSFVIIGGILMTLLVGGAYAVQQRSTQAERGDTVAVQPENTPVAEENEAAPKEDESQEAPAEKEAPKAEQKEAKEEAPKAEQKVTPETKPTPSPEKQPAPAATPAPAAPRTATELPETGPVEAFSSIVGLGLLSAVSIAYVRSRRL